MNASSLISQDIVPLKTSDSGKAALELMNEYLVQHLPIVNNEQLLGLVSEEDILEHAIEEAVGSYDLSLQKPYVKEDDHIFEVLGQVAKNDLTVIPVIDAQENFAGVISQQSLLHFFAFSFSFAESGSIIVLEMSKPDYSLAGISRVVESEGVAILAAFVHSDVGSSQILVHLKINKTEVHRVMAALERYEYKIKAMYTENVDDDVFRDRFESFMHYLNV